MSWTALLLFLLAGSPGHQILQLSLYPLPFSPKDCSDGTQTAVPSRLLLFSGQGYTTVPRTTENHHHSSVKRAAQVYEHLLRMCQTHFCSRDPHFTTLGARFCAVHIIDEEAEACSTPFTDAALHYELVELEPPTVGSPSWSW